MNKRTDPHHIDRAADNALALQTGATKKPQRAAIGVGLPHESANLHVSGEATYVDDTGEVRGTRRSACRGMRMRALSRSISTSSWPRPA